MKVPITPRQGVSGSVWPLSSYFDHLLMFVWQSNLSSCSGGAFCFLAQGNVVYLLYVVYCLCKVMTPWFTIENVGIIFQPLLQSWHVFYICWCFVICDLLSVLNFVISV